MELTTHAMRPQIERLRRAWRHSPLPRFFAWWRRELVSCLPSRWRAALSRSRSWRYLRLHEGRWQWWSPQAAEPLAEYEDVAEPDLKRNAVAGVLAQVDACDLRVMLWLPPAQLLRRRLRLPLAALERLPQVVAFEMDRQTPFRADDVYFDVRELPDPAPEGQVMVELVATPRALLDDLLQRLADLPVPVDAVDTLGDEGRLGINLLPAQQRPRHRHAPRRRNLWLAAVALAVVLAAMLQWVHNRYQALATMQAQVDALRGQAHAVAQLRRQLAERAQAAGFLARRKAQSPGVLAVLADLSQRIPDDTWLERFSISSDERVGMQGQSPQAAGLIDRLKASPLIDEPSFQGVIQSDPRTHKERFFVVAQLHQDIHGRAHATGSP